jgi:uncharacterized protein YggE
MRKMKNRYPKSYGLAATLVVALLVAGGSMALAQNRNSQTTAPDNYENYRTIDISIIGNATVKHQPTQAVIYVGVVTDDDTATGACQRTAEIMTDVIRALTDIGIPENSIETAEYSISPRWNYYSNSIIGYTCTYNLKIVSGMSDVGRAIDAAVGAGANRVYSIEFNCSDDETKEAQRSAFYSAVRDAREQADMVADAFGATVIEVVGISMNPVYNYQPWTWYNSAATSVGSVPTPIQPGQVEVTSSVTVTYRIGWPVSVQ